MPSEPVSLGTVHAWAPVALLGRLQPSDHELSGPPALQNKIKESLEALLVVEKQARVAEDLECSKAVCTAILEVAHASGDWKQLLEHIVMLAKRRGQLKNAIQVRTRS